jgi:hypothetical protein
MAVGSGGVAEAGVFPFAERWSGSGWSGTGLPVPGGPYGLCSHGCTGGDFEMSGVSCATAIACVAVGNGGPASGGTGALVDGWDGTAWSIQDTPVPAGHLSGVSCVSASACVAVGSYRSPAGHQLALIERWDGTGWSTQNTPNPPGAPYSTLTGVSCTSQIACTAVGRYVSARGTGRALAERWNGVGWSIQQTPHVGAGASLTAVSCPSRRACIAVGTVYQAALIERWSSPI